MKVFTGIAVSTIILVGMACAGAEEGTTIAGSIENSNRTEELRERDATRKPADVLGFISLEIGDVVLDYGSGGGYWAELFSFNVGDSGKIYAHQRAGERFNGRKETLNAQFEPFGNIELLPLESGAPLPLADDSVDVVMLSYIYHHLHYAAEAGEEFPERSNALVSEFLRVLTPGGTFIVIEHIAADDSSRAESAGWHRTPPKTAIADITGVGFELAGEAPDLFTNPDDDLRNVWFETGLAGKTNTFVHKYRKPD